ncbi:VanZ family protein [Ruminiclostridium herbifermentans]|uniref:VanZ family protein n=1 Tax=Ruminiclostridium herbifermentans TaxID=2488810 RepID=A0A4U7JI54_9FIRM|nr:VanZ family protein [Ruminiclostridium herbifermentans]QNU65697.1 VanZ family protein [Ruminiclostridium herbifermentans]
MKIKFYNNIKYIKIIFAVLFTAYLLLLAYLTLASQYYGREVEHSSINIIPLRTIIEYSTSGYNVKAITTNLLGNIAAFMPMGFLLPIVFSKLNRMRKVIYVSFISALLIELMQYILRVGASDIDDVILNILGAVLGYWIMRCVRQIYKSLL